MGLAKRISTKLFANAKSVDFFGFNFFNTKATSPMDNPFVKENEGINNPVAFINKYVNKDIIEKALSVNPKIKKILEENKLSANYNLESVKSIIMSHLIPTAKLCSKIYIKMGHSTSDESYTYLIQAALLHDIGKIFIPSEILNKRGRLTNEERRIIELHNRLSYEILITTELNEKVANLTYQHHNYDKKLVKNKENQALMIADVYCALREKRPYKKPINDICAKTILYDMGAKQEIDSRYINLIN